MKSTMMRVWDLGTIDFRKVWKLQEDLVSQRLIGSEDRLLLLEHPEVITLGRNGKIDNLLVDSQRLNTEIIQINRGGNITWHGPGQLVGYPIMDLRNLNRDIHNFLRKLEAVLVNLLSDYKIAAQAKEGYTGVWVGQEKIASIGIGVKHWISFHGFALNVNNSLEGFALIKPCGLDKVAMTSMSKLLGRILSLEEIKQRIIYHFSEIFNETISSLA